MPAVLDVKHRRNAEALRSFYRRPSVRSIVRLYQNSFDEQYWKREHIILRKAERIEDKLYQVCGKVWRSAGMRATRRDKQSGGFITFQYPRVKSIFESRALLALRQLLGMTSNDPRIPSALVWFRWLVRNWDLDREDIPKLPPEILAVQPQLSFYAISLMPQPLLSGDKENSRPWHLNSFVVAQIFPGVSHRDLKTCMEEVYDLVNAQSDGKGVRRPKGGAPSSLADWQWQETFQHFGPVLKGISTRIPKIQEYIQSQYGVHSSRSNIRARYEAYLNSQ